MFRRAPAWFWLAIAFGAAIRFCLIVFTEGTADVANWEEHARGVHELGLFGYYQSTAQANHPPVILEAESLLWRAAQVSGIPFRILLRAPFAVLDLAAAFVLLNLLHFQRWRFLLVAIYWLNPLSLIFLGLSWEHRFGGGLFAVARRLVIVARKNNRQRART